MTSQGTSGDPAHVRVRVSAPSSIDDTWRLLTDWDAQARWIPLTTISRGAGPATGVGSSFVARTGIGPFRFDDPMTITEWRPPANGQPGYCHLEKSGRWVLGSATLAVTRLTDVTSMIEWSEVIRVRGVPSIFNPAVGIVGRVLFGATIRRAAQELEIRDQS